MNNYFSVCLLVCLFACSNKAKTNKTKQDKTNNIDSVFFKVPDIYDYMEWEVSNEENSNILRILNGNYARDYFWSNNKNNLMHLKLLAELHLLIIVKAWFPIIRLKKNTLIWGDLGEICMKLLCGRIC